ncbi:MAG: hypothetical protein FRX48_05677 [Lasallia pustulata]|uniref:Uncharacterized protein n=1 Tax=Lasallia pustulata TaxID=136370 RepID=A0A5M8PMX5_9LECA|nr:MAG: hypothetical protein FRX48_05677 [Lasallia pustulata]
MTYPTIIPPGGGRGRLHQPQHLPVQPRDAQLRTNNPDAQPRPPTPTFPARTSKARALLHYLHLVYLDLIVMALAASLMGALSFVPTYRRHTHLFPMWVDPSTKLWVGPVEYSYPRQPFILTTMQAALVDILVPVATILAVQVFMRSFWDANAAVFALLKALIVM